jgi:hypothetical protein
MADRRLVLVCSRSSGLGDLSRWGKALHARQQVVWPTTGSHTLRCLLTNGTLGSGVFAVEWSGRSIAMGQGTPCPSASRLAYDRLTHPTVPAHEWNVWFWCVRGRVIWAIYRDGARPSNTVSKSFGLPTGSHTLRCSCSRSCSCSDGTFGCGVFAVERSGRSVAMGHGTPCPSTSRLAFRPAHTPYGARVRARARARMERLVVVCSRSSGQGDRSPWGMELHARQQVVWPSDRLTHPTVLVLVLVLVLGWNVWFWCVRGRAVRAIGRHGAWNSMPVNKSFGLPTGSHTLRCS